MIDLFANDPDPDLAALWDQIQAIACGQNDPLEISNQAGVLENFAKLYLPIAAPRHTPFVIGQLGQSLDGLIATEAGASHYITGPQSLIHLHRLRALCDAVVVGWRTVAMDDPQLSVRHVTGRNPLRVVIDLKGRLPLEHRIFSQDAPGALRITAPNIPPLSGIESVEVDAPKERFDPVAVIKLLAARGCRRILIEGGGATVSSFLNAGTLDRLHLAIAPLLLGRGRRGIDLPPVERLDDALRPGSAQIAMGQDVLFDLDLQKPKMP